MRAVGTEWCVDIVEGGKLGPVSGVEVVNLILIEDKAAGVGVHIDGPIPVAACATRAFSVAPIIALDEVDFNRRPTDVTVKAGFPAPR